MNNKQLADKLTTELTGALQYIVTDDIQLFSKDMRLGGEEYVPCVLSTITSLEQENRYIKTIQYELRFKVKNTFKDDFYGDLEDFKQTQLTEVIGSYVVTKIVESPIFSLSGVDNGIDYYEFTVSMIWTYALSKVGTNAVIKVDTVQIPFTDCDVTHDVGYISNISSGENYRATNDVIVLRVPLILGNTKVDDLYDYINSDNHNRVFALDIDGVIKSVVLKRGQYTFTNTSSLVGMILTFETSYPRKTITINGETLSVSSYQYNGKKTIDLSARTNDAQKGYGTSKVRTWSMTFLIDDSDLMNSMIDDAYGDVVGETYTLVVRGKTFTVEMSEGVESYTETGDMTLQCQFVEYE